MCEDERMGARGSKTKSDISVEACVKKCAFAEPLDESTAHVPPREGVLKLVLKESGTSWTTTAWPCALQPAMAGTAHREN